MEARLAALPSVVSCTTLLGREFGLPDQDDSRTGVVKGILLPDIWDSGRDGPGDCRPRRGVPAIGDVESDMVLRGNAKARSVLSMLPTYVDEQSE